MLINKKLKILQLKIMNKSQNKIKKEIANWI